MKKGLILLVLLTALSVFGVVKGGAYAQQQKENVVINLQVLEGDLQAARGWEIQTASTCDGKLNWVTGWKAEDAGSAHSTFSFVPEGERQLLHVFQEKGIYLGTPGGFGMSGGIPLESTEYGEIFRKIGERTDPGAYRTEQVYLADYYEYYPLTLEIVGSEYTFYMEDLDPRSVEFQAAMEKLQIPVHPRDQLELTVGKDQSGRIVDVSCNSGDGFLDTNCTGFDRKDGCYFASTPVYWDGQTSHPIEGARGAIYHMPIVLNENRELTGFDQIDVIAELPEGAVSLGLAEDEAGNLILLTRQQGELVFTVYENGTWRQLQQLFLLPMKEGTYYNRMSMSPEGILISLGDGAFALVTENSGEYQLEFVGQLYPDWADYGDQQEIDGRVKDVAGALLHYEDFAYDGQQLVVVGWPYQSLSYSNSVCLGIYSPAGRELIGYYSHSGDIDWKLRGYAMNCRHDEREESLQVWK